jgi:hypothetical protein
MGEHKTPSIDNLQDSFITNDFSAVDEYLEIERQRRRKEIFEERFNFYERILRLSLMVISILLVGYLIYSLSMLVNRSQLFIYPKIEVSQSPESGESAPSNKGELSYQQRNEVCSVVSMSGDKSPKIIPMRLFATEGVVRLKYNTFTAKDLIRVIYEDEVIFDSGCIGTMRDETKEIPYSGNDKKLQIHVTPNCQGGEPHTRWSITSDCL